MCFRSFLKIATFATVLLLSACQEASTSIDTSELSSSLLGESSLELSSSSLAEPSSSAQELSSSSLVAIKSCLVTISQSNTQICYSSLEGSLSEAGCHTNFTGKQGTAELVSQCPENSIHTCFFEFGSNKYNFQYYGDIYKGMTEAQLCPQ